jgi:GT2 family glycosyltransferase
MKMNLNELYLLTTFMLSISVLTIVHQRKAALLNLIEGLERATVKPAELVIVFMNEDEYILPVTSFPLSIYKIVRQGHLLLAEARNLAAVNATHEHLVFLDVDCIPGPDLLSAYAEAFEREDYLWTGPVHYLDKNATTDKDLFSSLNNWSKPDKIRDLATPITYELFWSLNFGCTKTVFELIGGFDNTFEGYGAEDTDFSFSARKNGVIISWVNAPAYHQYHPSYDPPLNHLANIVSNAKTFRRKWGVWPMMGWLRKFELGGYISWNDDALIIEQLPTDKDIELALKL